MILVLDAWSVHRSKEFREWIARTHPLMHLVFVPANCTSHLQVADVVLQKPFKSKIRERFGDWAAEIIKQQATAGKITGLRSHFGIKELRSLVLEWTLAAWNYLASPSSREMILNGWFKCVHAHYGVLNTEHRKKAAESAARGELKAYDFVPLEEEPEKHGQDVWRSDSDNESDEENDDLDLTKPIPNGERRSKRAKCDRQHLVGFCMLDSSRIEFSDDDES